MCETLITLLLYLLEGLTWKQQELTNVDENVDKREFSWTADKNVNWCSHYGKQYGGFKKLKIELSCDPVILFLSLYTKEKKNTVLKDMFTLMFIVASYTIAKKWKQPKWPLMKEYR